MGAIRALTLAVLFRPTLPWVGHRPLLRKNLLLRKVLLRKNLLLRTKQLLRVTLPLLIPQLTRTPLLQRRRGIQLNMNNSLSATP